MMIDTGATVCIGTQEELVDVLKLEPNGEGDAKGLGGNVTIKYVDARVEVGDLTPIDLQIGYPVVPKVGEQWILGQSFLGEFQHNWTQNTRVEIKYPVVHNAEVSRIIPPDNSRCCCIM
jgi:hypothetical protein